VIPEESPYEIIFFIPLSASEIAFEALQRSSKSSRLAQIIVGSFLSYVNLPSGSKYFTGLFPA
jgi:hypothetical protein